MQARTRCRRAASPAWPVGRHKSSGAEGEGSIQAEGNRGCSDAVECLGKSIGAAAAFCDRASADVAVDQRDKTCVTSLGGEPLKEAGKSGDFGPGEAKSRQPRFPTAP